LIQGTRHQSSDCDDVLSSMSPPSRSFSYEIEMEKLKAETEKLGAARKSKSSKYKSEKSELYADYCALREKHFKVFKHICEVRDGCEYRTYRKDYLESHMKTCRKKLPSFSTEETSVLQTMRLMMNNSPHS